MKIIYLNILKIMILIFMPINIKEAKNKLKRKWLHKYGINVLWENCVL